MSLVIPPGYASAAFIYASTTGTPPVVTTLGVDTSDNGGEYVAIANMLHTYWGDRIMPLTDTSLTLDRVTLSVGQDGPGGSVDSTNSPIAGSRSGDGPPVSMATIARKTTNILGRRGRGRMFIPGLLTTTNVNEGGLIAQGRRDQIESALADFIDDITTDVAQAVEPVLLHSSAPADPTPIVSLTVSPLVGWIRGRIR